MTIDEKVFDASTFSKNRDRLLTHAIAQEFLSSLPGLPEVKGLLSAEHFSVLDGTLLKAWASMKSFRPKSASGEGAGNGPGEPPPPGRNREADFRKTKRSNKSHASTTDKDARLYRKGAGQESRLCYLGHALMENRNAAGDRNGRARGGGGFQPALAQGGDPRRRQGYDAEAFVESLKARGIEPHIAINGTVSKHGKARKTAVPSEVAASVRYAISQRLRKRIEEGFGWTKTVGGLTQVKVRGLAKVRAAFVLAMAAYNIVRLPGGAKPGQRHEEPENNDPTSRQNSEREPHPAAKNCACTPGCANAADFFSSLLERLFMEPTDDPFGAISRLLQAHKLGRDVDAIIVDFHCEATGEKQAMGHFCDGRVSLVVGTHTHTPSADHRVLAGGTAYITDVGMTGDYDFVVGMQKEEPVRRFATGVTFGRFLPAEGAASMCGVAVETDPATGLATCIAPVRLGGPIEQRTPGFWE